MYLRVIHRHVARTVHHFNSAFFVLPKCTPITLCSQVSLVQQGLKSSVTTPSTLHQRAKSKREEIKEKKIVRTWRGASSKWGVPTGIMMDPLSQKSHICIRHPWFWFPDPPSRHFEQDADLSPFCYIHVFWPWISRDPDYFLTKKSP